MSYLIKMFQNFKTVGKALLVGFVLFQGLCFTPSTPFAPTVSSNCKTGPFKAQWRRKTSKKPKPWWTKPFGMLSVLDACLSRDPLIVVGML